MVKIREDDLPMDAQGRDELKKLYQMTEKKAVAETIAWDSKDHSPGGPFPLQKWLAAKELLLWHGEYTKGRKAAIPEGLYLCTLNDLPIPRWLIFAYLGAYRDVRQYRQASWDNVLGKPHPKFKHAWPKRKRREKALLVYLRIKEIRKKEPDTPIDGYLFERVGKEFGVGGKTLTEGYYYEWEHRLKKR